MPKAAKGCQRLPKVLLWTLRIVSVALVVRIQLTSRHLRIPIITFAPDVVLLVYTVSLHSCSLGLLRCKVPELPAMTAASELLTIRADWRMAGHQRWKERLGVSRCQPTSFSAKAAAKSLKAI